MPLRSRIWTWLSQGVNTFLFGGDPDESLSARAYRENWKRTVRFLDKVLGEGHCNRVWQAQRTRERARWV